MRLAETLLASVAKWRVTGGRESLPVRDEGAGWGAALTADRCDELGCQLSEMTLRRSTPFAARGGEALQAWAGRIAGRVSGLLESLKVVEVDPERDEAMLRSADPTVRNDQLFYYEFMLKGVGEVTVRRYRSSHQANRREQIAFVMTHEALAKLADDLTAE